MSKEALQKELMGIDKELTSYISTEFTMLYIYLSVFCALGLLWIYGYQEPFMYYLTVALISIMSIHVLGRITPAICRRSRIRRVGYELATGHMSAIVELISLVKSTVKYLTDDYPTFTGLATGMK
jgi:hypothetical protein